MKYFFLEHHCILVNGKRESAIYDLYNNEIYKIDNFIGKVIDKCEKEFSSLDTICKCYTNKKKVEIYKYFENISKLGLGKFYNHFIINEKVNKTSKREILKEKKLPTPLVRLWLEIETKCNLNCVHCNNHLTKNCRCSCSVNPITNSLSLKTWKSIIDDASLLECKEIHLIGGEPLLNRKLLYPVIKYLREKNKFLLIIHTNGTLLNEDDIIFFRENNVGINFKLFSYNIDIYDSITKVPGSFNKLLHNIKLALHKQVNITATLEIMKMNQDEIAETINFFDLLGITEISISFVTAEKSKFWPDKFESYIYKSDNSFQDFSKEIFFKNIEGNSCWDGQFAVTQEGNILPCIMARNEIISNVSNKTIKNILVSNKEKKWWELTKDKIETCEDCEYRYVCFDCRVRECIDGKLTGKNKFCQVYF